MPDSEKDLDFINPTYSTICFLFGFSFFVGGGGGGGGDKDKGRIKKNLMYS